MICVQHLSKYMFTRVRNGVYGAAKVIPGAHPEFGVVFSSSNSNLGQMGRVHIQKVVSTV